MAKQGPRKKLPKELAVINADNCTGCHQRMSGEGKVSGPVTCGECHVRREPGVSARVFPAFDRSLHARHDAAYPDDCAQCHHVWDEATQKLVHRENTEERCAACHGEAAEGDSDASEGDE